MSRKLSNAALLVAGALCIGLAAYYWVTPASALPHYLPGYDPSIARVHFKHGLGALIVGAALLVWVWFRTGKRDGAEAAGSSGASAGSADDK